jgi:hypothetical protein
MDDTTSSWHCQVGERGCAPNVGRPDTETKMHDSKIAEALDFQGSAAD